MKIFVRFCLFLFLSGGLFAGLLKVPENYSTIQSAIDAATNGDTVLVSLEFTGKILILTVRPLYLPAILFLLKTLP